MKMYTLSISFLICFNIYSNHIVSGKEGELFFAQSETITPPALRKKKNEKPIPENCNYMLDKFSGAVSKKNDSLKDYHKSIKKVFKNTLPVVEGFKLVGPNKKKYPEYTHLKTKMIFVLLPGGEFEMGSYPHEKKRKEDEGPVHKVKVSPFLFSKYEVSQKIWKQVMKGNPSRIKYRGDNLPVVDVSWDECYGDKNSFCKKLKLNLPTEAQWEYACRAGTKTPFSFGNAINSTDVNFNSNFTYNGSKKKKPPYKPAPVISFKPNNFGLHNMHGNVWEWCLDSYGPYPSNKKSIRNGDIPIINKSNKKVNRGGGWMNYPWFSRSANRDYIWSSSGLRQLGFRPVKNLNLNEL